MIRKLFTAAVLSGGAVLCLSGAASAQYAYHGSDYGYEHGYYETAQPVRHNSKCKREKDENRVAGAVVGAIAGGLLGSAIGGEIDDDNDRYHNRGYRGHRGYRGYRGYRGHRGRHHRNRDSDGAQIAGAVLGAVVGGVAGSEIAAGGTDCRETTSDHDYRYGEIPPPRRVHTTSRDYGYTQTAPQPVSTTSRTVRTVRVEEDPLYGGPTETRRVVRTTTQPAPVYQPECQTVQRETRLPDGSIVREPVSVCQSSNGRWEFTDGQARY